MIETPFKKTNEIQDGSTQSFLERKNKVHCMDKMGSIDYQIETSSEALQSGSNLKKSKKTPVSNNKF